MNTKKAADKETLKSQMKLSTVIKNLDKRQTFNIAQDRNQKRNCFSHLARLKVGLLSFHHVSTRQATHNHRSRNRFPSSCLEVSTRMDKYANKLNMT
ncbi:CLUMA_CG009469, isoform A [Clunio marinus]|uniref:CLUMA_CG009469, isoform A n=1 Tax=Clunio marinus TaxID=568069 RepID=A0A1J1IAP3_9DIPT|nr:CLUMA_CG009469, isoform A [Clunio marinus]